MKQYLTIEKYPGKEVLVEEPESEYGFTYADYLTWNFKERIELIRGKIFKMSPAPTVKHQVILFNLSAFFIKKKIGSTCQMLYAPVDVRLKGKSFRKKKRRDDEITTVVQPDIIVVCDTSKLEDNRCIDGAPEMVIEILSPGNTKTETKYKLDLYEENGVLEFWMVHQEYKTVEVFLLKDDAYGKPVFYEMGDKIPCTVLKGLKVPVTEIFK
ncbi:MAG: Uma2 family endonuclease [Ferruginibacter sp.]